uniref:Conserved oligomeric Golgi complex subunit 1 n=1 Tax=Eutreptiella gymnastica TaxID=73025 RepID=A0A7S1NGN3_9EUGL|mmetsp:Transcript_35317/g.63102  ORF Transcript_35317/g.63102 Transcript_35317/m.63102 type:complete len:1003 (+) Transcript_35317:115-3123(+)
MAALNVHSENMNDVFQTYTVDQLRVYVTTTRKEVRNKQDELRQLVGDRYRDLITASDMIVDMGTVCKDLITLYDRPAIDQINAIPTSIVELQKSKALKKRQDHVDYLLRTATDANQQIWQWMDAGMYLEATMTYLQAQTAMEAAVKILKTNASQESEASAKVGVDLQHAAKLTKRLKGLPQIILSQSAHSISTLKAPTHSIPSQAFLAHYAESFCSILLLKGLTFTEALAEFLGIRKEKICEFMSISASHVRVAHTEPTSSGIDLDTSPSKTLEVDKGLAIEMLSSMQSVLCFLHAVFITQTMPINPSLITAGGMVAKNATDAVAKVYQTTTSLDASSPMVKAVNTKLNEPLPPKAEVERMCASWMKEVCPMVLDGVRSILASCRRAKDIIEIEESLLQLITGFSASFSSHSETEAPHPISAAIWNGDEWERGVAELVALRTEQLSRDRFRDLKAETLRQLREPGWGTQDVVAGTSEGGKDTWCRAIISDQDVSARYSLASQSSGAKHVHTQTTVSLGSSKVLGVSVPKLPPSLLDPSIPLFAHSVCEDFYHLLGTVLHDATHIIVRERQGSSSNKVEQVIHDELYAAFNSICQELQKVSAENIELDAHASLVAYISQGLGTVINALVLPFIAQMAKGLPTGTPLTSLRAKGSSNAPLVQWKKEALEPIWRQLHTVYMASYRKWIESTAFSVHEEMEMNIGHSYLGPDSTICKKLHASTWTHKKGDDGSLLHLPSMPQSYVFNTMYSVCQSIKAQNICLLRATVVQELDRQIAALVFGTYLRFVKDPAGAFGYSETDGFYVCEEGWLQLLFDVRFLGAVLLQKPHEAIIAQLDSGAALSPEEDTYVQLYRAIEESIDPINWNAYQGPIGTLIFGFLHSVSILLACHNVEQQPWAKKEKDKEVQKDDRVSLLALAPECDRFPLLPLLPLNTQASVQSSLRNLSFNNNILPLADQHTIGSTAYGMHSSNVSTLTSATPDASNSTRLVSKITGVSGVKKLWGMIG